MPFRRFFHWLSKLWRKKPDMGSDDPDDYHVAEEWTPVNIHFDLQVIVDPTTDPDCKAQWPIDPKYTPDKDHLIAIPAGTVLLAKVDNSANPGGWYWVYYKVLVDIPRARLYYKDHEIDGPFETRHCVRCVGIRTTDDARELFYLADGIAPNQVPTQTEV